MSDINGGQYPNPNGSPIWPGSVFTGPLIAGNVVHSDGSGTLAGVGETTGTANQGYANMCQSQAGVNSLATLFTTSIVIPAQSQITDIYIMTTTVQAAGTVSVGLGGGSATGFTNGGIAVSALGQLSTAILPTTAPQIALWDNVGNQDIQITLTFNATGAFVGTVTVFYIQGNNLAS
jgi:hypothetical protein